LFGVQRIGRYQILHHLASGGMGHVYLTRSTGLGGFEREMVIKTLDLAATDDDSRVTMFLDEARLLASLHHQYIAPVYDVGRDDDGRYYLVMDYIRGESAEVVWERAVGHDAVLPLSFGITVVSAIASALHYAHERRASDGTPLGIVHRDVTPSNVMIGYDGAIKLIDFGIAKTAIRNNANITQAGALKGRMGYLSPEQIHGQSVDRRTDVFALGIVLYELTTMARAFRGLSDLNTMERIVRGELTPPSDLSASYPLDLEKVVMTALAVDPDERFQTADEMQHALESVGRRIGVVMRDSAIVEVMESLFQHRGEPRPATPEPIADDKTVPVAADHIYIPMGPAPAAPAMMALEEEDISVPIVIQAVTPERSATPSRPLLVPVGDPIEPLTSRRTAKGSQAAIIYPRIRSRAWIWWLLILVATSTALGLLIAYGN
jgi:eukaryotic-like serine/threonine-protein kinase